MPETPLIPLSSITFIGEGLKRPESVVTTASGDIFAGDHDAGIVEIGKPKRRIDGAPPSFLPNGVTMLPGREFLIANLGPGGGVWHLDREWRLRPWLFEAEGEALRVCNYVGRERDGIVWVSVSTRQYPREKCMRPGFGDGFIVRLDPAKGTASARIVANDIGFTNEARVHPSGKWLYVNETNTRRVSRFPIDGERLGAKEVLHEFQPGELPDGLAFDVEGGVWVACVCANRLIRIDAEGRRTLILDDGDPADIAEAVAFFDADNGGRHHIEIGARRPLRNIASVAFGGPDLRTVYLGNLANDRLATFRSPITGAEPASWRL